MFGIVGLGRVAEWAWERCAVEAVGRADGVRKEFDNRDARGGNFKEGACHLDAGTEGIGVGVDRVGEEFGRPEEDDRDTSGRVRRAVVGNNGFEGTSLEGFGVDGTVVVDWNEGGVLGEGIPSGEEGTDGG